MTVKLLAMYARPEDEESFWAHYHDIHLPLIKKVPGLQKAVLNRVDANLMGGASPYFLIAELHFENQAAFDAGMASPENRSAGKDLMTFAKGIVTLLAVTEETP